MKNDNLVAPVLKWVGGKRQLLDVLTPLLPAEKITAYCEPFVGGSAMLFNLQPQVVWINDINSELINVYRVIRDSVEDLIIKLNKFENNADTFYAVREWDRDEIIYAARTDIEKAARIIYLNKTCFNGLFRVNSSGEFNSPFGKYRNPNIVNATALRAVSAYFKNIKLRLTDIDYADVLKNVSDGMFVYLDPPYDPVSSTANFTGYAWGGFSRKSQIMLRYACDDLTSRGIKFMLSNSATDFVKKQYAAYNIVTVQAKRAINSNGVKRCNVEEVVIRNYE